MATIKCEIVTPESRLFSADAEFVVLPAAEGEMGVLPQHEPVVTTLNAGSARLTIEGSKEPLRYVVAGGYAQIDGEQVIILADRAIAVADIDADAVREQVAELRDKVDDLADDDPNKAYVTSELAWNELVLAQV